MSNTNQNLQNHVNDIARRISEADFNDVYDDGEEQVSAYDYLQDALDIEYIVSSKKEFLGARVLVAFGGPNIWVNTRTNTVEGHWWGESATAMFTDTIGLNDALEELYNC